MISQEIYMNKIEHLLKQAIQEDGVTVVYQPIYSLELQRFVTAEALVRLKDQRTLGEIPPGVFIPLAEKRGYIWELGNIVFEKVCQFMREAMLWRYGMEYVEVNLSGVVCEEEKLPDVLAECMKKYQISPTYINFEITETASVTSGDMLEKNMRRLQDMGFRFSMDDFGTGYSNLSQIAKIPFELIKLDKSLIWPCFDTGSGMGKKQEDARALLRGCVEMISRLGIKMVAEGVETKEQAIWLRDLGISYMQGFYFSRPLCEADYLDFVVAHAGKRMLF